MIKILIVEDEKAINDLLNFNLSDAGYACTCCYDGIAAVNILEQGIHFDLVLLDIMLPGANGIELLDYIKPLCIPVIFLTAKASLQDKVQGLTLGAEDYITKPFEIVELLARIHVVLRRYHKDSTLLTFHNITIDLESNLVHKEKELISLTPKEFELLVLFVRNVDITLFREKIYEIIWESDAYGDTRTLDLHVQRLRKKAGLENSLKTVYKIGYRLESGDKHEISI